MKEVYLFFLSSQDPGAVCIINVCRMPVIVNVCMHATTYTHCNLHSRSVCMHTRVIQSGYVSPDYLSFHRSIDLAICLYIDPGIYLTNYLPVYLSICQPSNPSINQAVSQSMNQTNPSLLPSIPLSCSLSFSLSLSLLLSLSLALSLPPSLPVVVSPSVCLLACLLACLPVCRSLKYVRVCTVYLYLYLSDSAGMHIGFLKVIW